MANTTYTRRPLPANDLKGFMDVELQNIQRAIDVAQSGSGLTATAPIDITANVVSHDASGVTPGTYGGATKVAVVTTDGFGHITGISEADISGAGGSGVVTAQRTSDTTNSTNGGASAITCGLTHTIANGESWYIRWTLNVKRSASPAGSAAFYLAAIPAASKVTMTLFGPSSGITALTYSPVTLSGTPATLGTVVGFDPGSKGAQVTLELTLRNVTSGSTVDILFGPSAGGGESVTIADGSHLLAFPISASGAAIIAHATTHENGGSDEINVAGLSGVLADPQPPIIGSGATQAVAGNDSRLTNARTPTTHATSHQDGGSDEIVVTGLSGLLGDTQPVNCAPSANVTVLANYCLVAVRKYALPASVKLALGDGATMRII